MSKVKSHTRFLVIAVLALLVVIAVGNIGLGATKYVIKYSFVTPPDSVNAKGVAFFKQRVETLSKGRIEVQAYPSSQLGDKVASMEGLRAGTIEMVETAATDMSNFSKKWSAFALPYLFMDEDHLFRVLHNRTVSKILNEDAEICGFKILGWWTFGSRNIFNSKRPVRTPADLKGLKIRVMQDPVLAQVISLMGATPVPMPWSEVYTALQQKVIDGLENSAPLIADNKLYEVGKYFSLTEHFRIPDPQLISMKFFTKLPRDLQKVLVQAGEETEKEYRRIWNEYEGVAKKVLLDNGVQINEADKEAFAKAVEPIYDKVAPEVKYLVDIFKKAK